MRGVGWVDNDLTALAGGASATGFGLFGYWGSDCSRHLNFIDGDGHVTSCTSAGGRLGGQRYWDLDIWVNSATECNVM
jgi:hypothetical protein